MSDAWPSTARRWLLLVVVPLLVAVAGAAIYLSGGRYVETDNAFVKSDIILVSPDNAGRVTSVPVRENQTVEAGQLLLTLDGTQFEIERLRAEAMLARERADVEALRASYREKQAEIALERSRFQFANRDLKRQSDLVRKRFAPASQLDDARQVVDEAKRRIVALRESLNRIDRQLAGGLAAPIDEHPAVKAAAAQVRQAMLSLSRTELRAPVAGVVSKLPAVGSHLDAGQAALTLVVSGSVWIEANFTETEITHMRSGQRAYIEVDAYPEHSWQAAVDSFSPATGAEYAILPPQNASGNWVKVPQRVPVRLSLDRVSDDAPLRAGLSATVSVDTGHQRTILGWRP